MPMTVRIGLVGDRSEGVKAHTAIPESFAKLAAEGGPTARLEWLATARLEGAESAAVLGGFDGLWCVPGSPYASMNGALAAIRYARENQIPFLGTCGGFQHALLEVIRDVVGVGAADHAESNPACDMPVIHRMACSLVGARGYIRILAGSRLAKIYGALDAQEAYHCSYGLNPQYRALVESSPLQIVAWDQANDPRAVELPSHPFFVATLFQPELAVEAGRIHPVVRAFARAAERFAEDRGDERRDLSEDRRPRAP